MKRFVEVVKTDEYEHFPYQPQEEHYQECQTFVLADLISQVPDIQKRIAKLIWTMVMMKGSLDVLEVDDVASAILQLFKEEE
jgi:hypothetical protein